MEINNSKTDLRNTEPEIRHLSDMGKVLYDKEWAEKTENKPLYYIYKGLKQKEGLRYDITIIPPKVLGKEWVKTKGHKHIESYPELYIVLQGNPVYLMQKRNNGSIEDVFAVQAEKGQIVSIPEEYGHITINPGSQQVKMANWVYNKVKSDYSYIQKKKGACYFALKQKEGIQWVKNKNYKNVPELRFESPLREIPSNLDYLKGE